MNTIQRHPTSCRLKISQMEQKGETATFRHRQLDNFEWVNREPPNWLSDTAPPKVMVNFQLTRVSGSKKVVTKAANKRKIETPYILYQLYYILHK